MERLQKVSEASDSLAVLSSAVPPVTVSTLTIFGVTLHDWVYLATIIYTVIATIALLRKLCKEIKEEHSHEEDKVIKS